MLGTLVLDLGLCEPRAQASRWSLPVLVPMQHALCKFRSGGGESWAIVALRRGHSVPFQTLGHRLHTQRRPPCHVCDTDSWPFTGQKLFSCHVCSNAFSTKGSLKVHMRLHTGAKPFKCPHCELRFRTSGRRKTHMQFHYKPDPKKARKSTPRSAPEGLQPASLLSPASADPNLLIMNNSVLTGQFDPNLLQPGLVSQAVLPGSVSGMAADGDGVRALRHTTCLQM